MTPSHERCAVRRDELSAYHDRALAPSAAAVLAEHIARCPDCRGRLARLAEVDRAIASLSAPEMSLAEREALVARLAALRRRAPSAARVEKERSWWRGLTPRVLAPLAAAALVLVIVLRVGDRQFSAPESLRQVAPAPAEAPAPSSESAPAVESPPSSNPALGRGLEESAARTSEFDQRAQPEPAPDAKAAKTLDETHAKRELAPQKSELATSMEKEDGKIGAQVAPENAAAGARASEPADAMAERPESAVARDRAPSVAETPPPTAPPAMTFSKERGTSGGTKLQESPPAGLPAPPPPPEPAPALAAYRLANPGSAIDVVKSRLNAGDLAGARVALEHVHVGALPESLAVEATHASFEIAARSADVDDCARAAAIADTVLGRFPAVAAADSLRAARAHLPCAPR